MNYLQNLKKKNQFVFKIEYDDGTFHEKSAKNYLSAVLKGTAKSQGLDIKILNIKTLSNYVWLETDYEFNVKWFKRKINGKESFIGFSLTQLRANNFFKDI